MERLPRRDRDVGSLCLSAVESFLKRQSNTCWKPSEHLRKEHLLFRTFDPRFSGHFSRGVRTPAGSIITSRHWIKRVAELHPGTRCLVPEQHHRSLHAGLWSGWTGVALAAGPTWTWLQMHILKVAASATKCCKHFETQPSTCEIQMRWVWRDRSRFAKSRYSPIHLRDTDALGLKGPLKVRKIALQPAISGGGALDDTGLQWSTGPRTKWVTEMWSFQPPSRNEIWTFWGDSRVFLSIVILCFDIWQILCEHVHCFSKLIMDRWKCFWLTFWDAKYEEANVSQTV